MTLGNPLELKKEEAVLQVKTCWESLGKIMWICCRRLSMKFVQTENIILVTN